MFDLQPGVKFHDGRSFTSADVVYSLLRVRDDPQTEWIGLATGVADVSAPAALRVVIRTAYPFPILLRYLAAIAIVPRPRTEGEDLGAQPVGTGPYRFESAGDGRGVVRLGRWAGYWGPAPARGVCLRRYSVRAAGGGRVRPGLRPPRPDLTEAGG